MHAKKLPGSSQLNMSLFPQIQRKARIPRGRASKSGIQVKVAQQRRLRMLKFFALLQSVPFMLLLAVA